MGERVHVAVADGIATLTMDDGKVNVLSPQMQDEIHAGLDEQARPGYSIETLLADGRAAGVPFSIAGGVSVDTIASVKEAGADVAVAGSARGSKECTSPR